MIKNIAKQIIVIVTAQSIVLGFVPYLISLSIKTLSSNRHIKEKTAIINKNKLSCKIDIIKPAIALIIIAKKNFPTKTCGLSPFLRIIFIVPVKRPMLPAMMWITSKILNNSSI